MYLQHYTQKPTDSHDYVLYSSAHPQRCKDSITYSQFLRIRRNSSDIDDFDHNVIFLGKFFLERIPCGTHSVCSHAGQTPGQKLSPAKKNDTTFNRCCPPCSSSIISGSSMSGGLKEAINTCFWLHKDLLRKSLRENP